MSSNNYYVYIFLRTDKKGYYQYGDLIFNYEPFYVGKGINDRIKSSLGEVKYNRIKNGIISKIHKNDMEVKSIKIKENLSESDAFNYEKYVINIIGRISTKDGPLSNITIGGEGFSDSPVLQYDINGKFIKEFSSIGEATSETSILNIGPCCRGLRKMAGMNIWKYKIDSNYPMTISVEFIKEMMHFGNYETPVLQYDINGKFIKEYSSIKKASEETGCSSPRIVDVCKGNRKQTKGFKWEYKNKKYYEDIYNK